MLAAKIVEAVRSVIGDGPEPLHEPLLNGSFHVANCVSNNQVTQGEYVERFEQMLCEFTGAKHAIATCNATCALYISIKVLGYYADIPALTFIATANAAVHAGSGVSFCEPENANIPVDLLGHKSPAEGGIRDSAQALGTSGIYGDHLTVHSFNGNKIITTGGGGAILTNNGDMADHIRHIIAQSRVPHAWEIKHDALGFNFRMPNINAALGCSQMDDLPYILHYKRKLAEKYIEAFESIGVKMITEPDGTRSNYWLNAIILDNPADQEPTLRALHDAGYLARMLPTPLHMLEPYKNYPRDDLSKSEDLWRRVICLPSSPALGVQYA